MDGWMDGRMDDIIVVIWGNENDYYANICKLCQIGYSKLDTFVNMFE